MANQALIRNAAFDTSQGFLDQLKCLPFSTIQTALNTGAWPKGTGNLLSSTFTAATATTNTTSTLVQPNLATYTTLPPIPTNTATSNATVSTTLLQSMATISSYGIIVALTAVTDTPAAPTSGGQNAILVTIQFQYKYTPNDTAFKTDAVSYLVPNIN